MRQNRRPKIYFATQVATNPPTVVLFTNGPQLFDNTYQRYLLKHFRDRLPFHEVPIKLYLRAKKRDDQPDAAETDTVMEPAPAKRPGRSKAPDLSKLKFTTTASDEELERGAKGAVDSELWRDL
jgi:hypothetical protein